MENLLKQYKQLTEKMDMLEIEKKEIREQIVEKMKEENLEKFESEIGKINFSPATIRQSFDSNKFKADNPFLYMNYIKETEIKENVKILL